MLKRRIIFRGIALLLATGVILVSVETSELSATNATGRTFSMSITTESVAPVNDYFGTGPRVVFSTAAGRKRPDTILKLVNSTSTPVDITNVASTSDSFVVDSSTANDFEIAPQSSVSIPLAFRPKSVGVAEASLELKTSDTTLEIALSGVNTKGIEGSNEASLQAIFEALGYDINVDMPTTPPKGIPATKSDEGNSMSMSNSAVGDELLTPVFTKADPSRLVNLVPVANYMGRTKGTLGWLGINDAGNNTSIQRVLAFQGAADVWGGENQQLLPAYGDGSYSVLTPGSTVSFDPGFEKFGFADQQHGVFSEDQLNYNNEHDVRIYPAKTTTGDVVPNTYLIAEDSTASNHYKNYDYQDFVFLISNVKPAN